MKLVSRAQVLTDTLSPKRDKVFHQLQCGEDELFLRRILKDGESFSTRKGREILVATNGQSDSTAYEFEDIDGYSSLFFESASFDVRDLNSDGTEELIIEIEAFESANAIWIYQLDSECNLSYLTSLIVNEYEVIGEELVTKKNAVCTYWDTCLFYEGIFGRIDHQKLTKTDFYKLTEDQLINTNSEHPTEMNRQIADYKIVLDQLEELKKKTEFSWEETQIDSVENSLNQTIKSIELHAE